MEPLRIRIKASSRQLILCCAIVLTVTSLIGFSHPRLVNASSTLTFIPVADSYVNQSYPTYNYGNSTSIRVDGSPLVYAYLRFDVIGIDSNLVTKVTLMIYANSSSSAGFTVYKVEDNSWEETGITYNNAPPPGSQVGASNSFSGNTWVDIDVTPLLNTDGTVSIVLLGINQTAINLAARENSNYAPQLLVETSEPSTATATETIEASATVTASPVPSTTPSPTATALPFPSSTPSLTATASPSPTPTATASPTPSFTPTPTATAPEVPSITPTSTTTASPTPSITPTPTATASPTFSITPSSSATNSPVPSNTPTLTDTVPPVPSATQTPTATASPIPSSTPTLTATASPIPSSTPTPTDTVPPVPSATQIPTATASPIPSSTPTLTVTASPIPSITLTFVPGADSYVNQSYPTRNYGSKRSIRVDGSPLVHAYLRFDITGIVSNLVTKVTLKIYASSSSSAGFTVNRVDDNSWEETGITYNNAPVPGSQVGASNGFSKNSWVEIDITPLLNNDGTVSIALLGINQTAINLAARENSSYTPQLLVEILEPSEATATWTLEPSVTANPTDLPSATSTASPIPSTTPIPTVTASPGPSSTPTWTPTPAPTNDPIIFFVGDLVSGNSVSRAQSVVDLIQTLMSQHPGTQMLVASVGDNEQESSPTISNYESYFGTTYGPFVTQGIFMQVRGNHDIQSAGSYTDFDGQVHSSGAAYWDYFGADAHMFDIDGKKLTDYSYDLGTWHIVALDQLNGNVNQRSLDFLITDLAFHASSTCQMVYWHVPTYSSGAAQGDEPGLTPFNQAEYDAGVDIQLNGHDHDYQRFFPINPDGVRDDDNGITTFIVGIGGQDSNSGSQTSIAQAASAVFLDTFPPGAGHAIGVVQFTLHEGSADYQLFDANDGSILDQGTVVCH